MNLTNLVSIISSIQIQAYLVILIAMILEGPLVTISASFAASLGVFNIWIIFALSVLGDLIGDFFHFFIGRYIDRGFIKKYGKNLGIKEKNMKKIKKHMENHLKKTLFFAKLAPPLATPALLLAGAGKISLKKFAIASFLVTLPRTIILVVIGYFFGSAYLSIARYIEAWQYLVILAVIFIALVFLIYKLVLKIISKRVI